MGIRKKALFIIFLIFIVLLTGSSHTGDADYFRRIKYDLSLLPEKYSEEAAAGDGIVVLSYDGSIKDKKVIQKFKSDCEKKKTSEIAFFMYTIEGDPLIKKVYFDGHDYYWVMDVTRDKFDSKEFYDYKFNYLKVIEHSGVMYYILLMDNAVTAADIWKDNSEVNCDIIACYKLYR